MHEPRLVISMSDGRVWISRSGDSMWDFLREIKERGKTIILTEHYLEKPRRCAGHAINRWRNGSSSVTGSEQLLRV